MPGHDGTGPKGLGPMTGRGGGYCLLKIPRIPGEPKTGFVGLSGKLAAILPGSLPMDFFPAGSRLLKNSAEPDEEKKAPNIKMRNRKR